MRGGEGKEFFQYLVVQQSTELIAGDLHGKELHQQTKCSGCQAGSASRVRLNVVDLVVDLIDQLVVRLELHQCFEVVRVQNVGEEEVVEVVGSLVSVAEEGRGEG